MALGHAYTALAASQLLVSVETLRSGQLSNHLVLPDGQRLDVRTLRLLAGKIGAKPPDVLVFDLSSGKGQNLSNMTPAERSKWLCGSAELAAYDPSVAFGFRPISSQTNVQAWLQLLGRVAWLPRVPASGSCGFRSASLQSTPAHIDFDQVTAGMPQVQNVVLHNIGSANVALGTLQAPHAPFSIDVDQCSGMTLATGASCSFRVNFDPAGVGRVIDLVGIASDDAAQLQAYLLVVGGRPETVFKNGFD